MSRPLVAILFLAACEEPFRPYLPAAVVHVTPDSATVLWGARTQLHAIATDSTGADLPDRLIRWSSSNLSVARVSASGEVFAQNGGAATITATSGTAQGQATIAVHVPVAFVTFGSAVQTVLLDGTTRLTAIPRDSTGRPLWGRPVAWSSSDTTIAGVTDGLVAAIGQGTAAITATSEGRSAQLTLVVEAVTFTALAASATEHTCGLADGGRAFCWGSDILGEVGNGPGGATVNASPVAVAGGLTFLAITGGGRFSCGVTAANTGACWGSGARGRLGTGSLDNSPSPQHVESNFPFRGMSAGFAHGCGSSNDAVVCWGSGPALGSDGGKYGLTPVEVAVSLSLYGIDAGDDFTCALDSGGTPYCWGTNISGQLGRGDSQPSIVPVAVTGGHSFMRIVAGSRHTCGLTAGGATWCWGENSVGQLGLGSQESVAVPAPLTGAPPFVSLEAGGDYTCGLTGAGEAWCWGGNAAGQLGDGTTDLRLSPAPTGGALRFSALTLGGTHACGIALDRTAYCWGANTYGQLGDGTTERHATPVRVLGQR